MNESPETIELEIDGTKVLGRFTFRSTRDIEVRDSHSVPRAQPGSSYRPPWGTAEEHVRWRIWRQAGEGVASGTL